MVYKNLKKILSKIYRGIISVLKNRPKFFFVKRKEKIDLLMYDTIYPHPSSGFSLEEFSYLLKTFQSEIFLNPIAYSVVKSSVKDHVDHIEKCTKSPYFVDKKKLITKGLVNVNTKLFYCIFINNIYSQLELLEKHKIHFVFTLYPGGGFNVNNEISDKKLRRVLSSTCFSRVIVTQQFTKRYLLEHKFCKEEQIEYVFGGVVPQFSIKKVIDDKKYYPISKKTIDICFCGAKYMPNGLDKGYDLFIDTCKLLASSFDFVRFHVIGGFQESDYDIVGIEDKITFYGYQNYENLSHIFLNIDVIISLNRPFVLGKGAFDGFPLGTVVEAVLNGVVAVLSDELQQNTEFIDGRELIIAPPTVESCYEKLRKLILDPQKLYEISSLGKTKFEYIYSNENQITSRIKILKKELI